MIGCTFRNIHSSTLNVVFKSIDRSAIPTRRKNEFIIPGRHGTINYGLNTYDNRLIKGKITTVKNDTWEELRINIRDIAQWLSGDGLLIFDDELDKIYRASVYEYVGLEQLELFPGGDLEVVFDCQPFAESLNYMDVSTQHITTNPKEIALTVQGSAETGCVITIKNTGATNISGISIRRKVAI